VGTYAAGGLRTCAGDAEQIERSIATKGVHLKSVWNLIITGALVLVCALAPTRAESFGFVPGHFYTTDALSNTVNEMTASGVPVDSITLPAPYALGVRGLCFGPDGMLYVVAITDGGFDVLVLDSTGTIQSMYSSPAHIAGNVTYGKIAFATNGQFFVAADFFLDAFTPGSPNPAYVYSPIDDRVFDVKGLPSGNLLVLSSRRLDEVTTAGSLVRTITPDNFEFVDLRGVEFDSPTNHIFVAMGGQCCLGPSSPLLRLNGATGHVEALTSFNATDLLLSNDRKLVAASRVSSATTYDLNLNQLGALGSQRMFITQMPASPGPAAVAAPVPALSTLTTAFLAVVVAMAAGLCLRGRAQ